MPLNLPRELLRAVVESLRTTPVAADVEDDGEDGPADSKADSKSDSKSDSKAASANAARKPGFKVCSSCKKELPKKDFSASQYKKGDFARCKACLESGAAAAAAEESAGEVAEDGPADSSHDSAADSKTQTDEEWQTVGDR